MPAFFSEIDNNTLVLIDGLMAHDAPQTYEQMFALNVEGLQRRITAPQSG